MLKITADMFSGLPNPSWTVSDEQEIRALLKEMGSSNAAIAANSAGVSGGLGLRGFLVEPLSDELERDGKLGGTMYVAAGQNVTNPKANELAERLIGLAAGGEVSFQSASEAEGVPVDEDLKAYLLEQLGGGNGTRLSVLDTEGLPGCTMEVTLEGAAATCNYDLSPYNPGFWNNNATILRNNNCYNYASNKRTDTFAQPGRGCGSIYRAISCAEVTRASLCDGLRQRYNCFPASESPRYLVALVVAPGPRFVDFHWYRLMREGFWGHKPGSTPVRNVDNRNRVISDPATCDRGPYTHFCGYFYTCKSQKIR
jgi:hypothetical protein